MHGRRIDVGSKSRRVLVEVSGEPARLVEKLDFLAKVGDSRALGASSGAVAWDRCAVTLRV